MNIEILFEDEDLVAVNKPPFLPSHVTLDPARPHLQALVEKKLGQKLVLFHRLDVDTSGVILLGKSERINKPMSEIFLSKELEKKYWVVVEGRWLETWKRVRSYIRKTGGKWANFSRGKASESAETEFRILETTGEKTLLEAKLLTGKTHQIRLHCLEMGHPVCGDRSYGKVDKAGVPIALHAKSIEFVHPFTGQKQLIQAPLPDYWKEKWLLGFNSGSKSSL